MTKKNMLRKRNGFTLVELIVVIAILGILAAIIIPRIGGFRDSAERRAVQANHRILVAAAQMYYAETSAWPTQGSDLDDYFDTSKDGTDTGYDAFVADSDLNNGSHVVSGTGVVSDHKGGATEGTDLWTYTFDPAPTTTP